MQVVNLKKNKFILNVKGVQKNPNQKRRYGQQKRLGIPDLEPPAHFVTLEQKAHSALFLYFLRKCFHTLVLFLGIHSTLYEGFRQLKNLQAFFKYNVANNFAISKRRWFLFTESASLIPKETTN